MWEYEVNQSTGQTVRVWTCSAGQCSLRGSVNILFASTTQNTIITQSPSSYLLSSAMVSAEGRVQRAASQ